MTYVFHRMAATPLKWRDTARALSGSDVISGLGGAVYGIWRSQIGRPRDELTAITVWPEPPDLTRVEDAIRTACEPAGISSEVMSPTLRPERADPPVRQGKYAFRWFSTPEADFPEFLDLCAGAWPGFESAYDSQVIGLWRMSGTRTGGAVEEASGVGVSTGVRSLLLTRRPNLAMWERSKIPENDAEAEVRAKLSRRYDLCDWTVVSTSTLLTAEDTEDTARWT